MSHGEEEHASKLGFTEKRQLAVFEMIKSEVMSVNNKVAEVGYYAGDDENTIFKRMT